MSPTARTAERLRRRGYLAALVEKRVPYQPHITQDVWGFGDVLAAHPRERRILLVQATTSAHVAHRLAKARAIPELKGWLQAGACFEVWGWAKRGNRWQVRIVEVRGEDLAGVAVEAPRRRRGVRHWQAPLFGE